MFKQYLISGFSAIVILGAAPFATANIETDNPLHPSYYQSKHAAPAARTYERDSAPYVDTRNPLSPSFGRTEATEWLSTRGINSLPYVDSKNPLSPQFQR